MLVTLADWLKEREIRYGEAREKARELSIAIQRALEVEKVVAEIEKEKKENTEFLKK